MRGRAGDADKLNPVFRTSLSDVSGPENEPVHRKHPNPGFRSSVGDVSGSENSSYRRGRVPRRSLRSLTDP